LRQNIPFKILNSKFCKKKLPQNKIIATDIGYKMVRKYDYKMIWWNCQLDRTTRCRTAFIHTFIPSSSKTLTQNIYTDTKSLSLQAESIKILDSGKFNTNYIIFRNVVEIFKKYKNFQKPNYLKENNVEY